MSDNKKMKISEEQQGFRENRPTVDAIFTIRLLIEKPLEFKKPLFLCLVDLKKAFDRVQLSDVLQIHDFNNNNIKVIEQGLTEEEIDKATA